MKTLYFICIPRCYIKVVSLDEYEVIEMVLFCGGRGYTLELSNLEGESLERCLVGVRLF